MSNIAYPPGRPLSIGEVLDLTFQIYRVTVVKCLLYAAIGIIAGQLPNIYNLLKGRGFGGGLAGFARAAQGSQREPTYWVVYLVGLVLSVIFYAVVILRQDQLLRTGAAGGELPRVLRRVPGLILVVLIVAVCVGICFIPAGAVASLGPVAVILGMLLAVVLASYVGVRLCVAFVAFVVTGEGGGKACGHSWRLTEGSVWRLSAIITVGFLVLIAFWVVVSIIAGLVAVIVGRGDVAVIAAAAGVISILIFAFTVPFYTALQLAMFGDLRVRKEGADLESRIASA